MYTPNSECCELSIPNISNTLAKAVYQRPKSTQKLQERTELVTVLPSHYSHQNEKPKEDHVCSLAGAVRVSENCP